MSSNRYVRLLTTSVIAVGYALSCGSAAFAEGGTGAPQPVADDGEQLQEIVVTARRRSELLQDVPQTVTAVTPAEGAGFPEHHL